MSGGVWCDVLPENRAVLAVVGDGPDASCCLDQGLVSIVVELRSECLTRRRGESGVGDFGVLVELIRGVDGIRTALRRALAVADVVEVVAVAIRGIDLGGRIRQLAAHIVEIGVGVGRRERRARLRAGDAAACEKTFVKLPPSSCALILVGTDILHC